jgi:hypothetical protein
MLHAPHFQIRLTEKLGSLSSSQANQTGWTVRRVLGYYGTRTKDTPVFAVLQARTNRTQPLVLVFYLCRLMRKVFGCENVNRYEELQVGFASPRKFCRQLVKALAKILAIVSRRLAMLTNDRTVEGCVSCSCLC